MAEFNLHPDESGDLQDEMFFDSIRAENPSEEPPMWFSAKSARCVEWLFEEE